MSTKIVAIDGRGGAGKSSLAERLAQELGGAQILRTDDFASWENPLDWWPRLIEEALEPLSRNQLLQLSRAGAVTVLDVRPEDEFALGHVAGAVNIPLRELETRLKLAEGELRGNIDLSQFGKPELLKDEPD